MGFRAFLFIFGLTTHTAFSGHAETSVTWKDDVRGWSIAVDTSVGNGCFMAASFVGDTFLRVQMKPDDDTLEFIIGDLEWRSIEPGKLYPMEVQFGSRKPWTGEGLGYWFGEDTPALILTVPFADGRARTFIEELMQMTGVRVSYEGRQIARLSLSGTYAAMNEVIACQIAMRDNGPEAGADPFRSNSPRSGVDPFAD